MKSVAAMRRRPDWLPKPWGGRLTHADELMREVGESTSETVTENRPGNAAMKALETTVQGDDAPSVQAASKSFADDEPIHLGQPGAQPAPGMDRQAVTWLTGWLAADLTDEELGHLAQIAYEPWPDARDGLSRSIAEGRVHNAQRLNQAMTNEHPGATRPGLSLRVRRSKVPNSVMRPLI